MALKLHPDRNGSNTEFGKITNAYNVLKSIPAKPVKKQSSSPQSATRSQRTTRPQNPPEQDWSKYTKEYEQDESFWTEYERKFWENYGKFTDKNKGNAKMQDEDEDEKLDLAVKIEPSLCIGCCSCEVIAPNVFSIVQRQRSDKSKMPSRFVPSLTSFLCKLLSLCHLVFSNCCIASSFGIFYLCISLVTFWKSIVNFLCFLVSSQLASSMPS